MFFTRSQFNFPDGAVGCFHTDHAVIFFIIEIRHPFGFFDPGIPNHSCSGIFLFDQNFASGRLVINGNGCLGVINIIGFRAESEPVFRTGIAELDESLEQANVLIEQLRRANISIKNPAVSAHIDRMTRSGDAILAELNAHPEKARKLRRFLTYYLPTSVKFMQTYAEHEAAPTGGENSAEIMRGIENNSETIAKAFETSLDSLYAGEALDISSDIDVLNGMVNAKTSMFE